MTGIIKTDQLQGAQSSTITIPSGNNLTVGGAFTSQGIDDNANAVAITIDTSENVLVKKTASNYQSVGVEAKSTGQLWATADGNNPILAVRKSSDGKIQTFFKDTTEVGSIGVDNSTDLVITSTDDIFFNVAGASNNILQLYGGSGANSQVKFDSPVYPLTDNTRDLGNSTERWQDLYLSGGAFIGGTGSANYLDDYEEGSWTPSLGGNTVYNSQVGKYTKIGNLVTIMCNVYVNTQGTGSVSQISGLPFTVSNITEYNANGSSHVAHCAGLAQNVSSITPAPMKNATTIRFFYIAAGGGNTNAANSNVFQNGTDMYFTCTYRTG